METNDLVNTICIVVSVCILAIYHIILALMYRKNPRLTVFGLTSSARRVFIASIMARKDAILAVQTLRNLIMMSSAMASTAIIVIIGLIAFLSAVGTKSVSSETTNPIRFESLLDNWFPVKIVLIIVCLMCAFFCFAQAMRFLNHTCISVNINISEEELQKLDDKAQLAYHSLSADVIADMMNRGAFYNTCGIRCYYMCFPLIAWVGGPYYLLGAAILLVIILRQLDFNVNVKKRNLTATRNETEVGNQAV